jgi:hypothetical protein
MSDALKKTFMVVTGTLVSMVGQVAAANQPTERVCADPKHQCGQQPDSKNDQNQPPCCETQRVYAPSPCCAPMCRASPYSGVNCIPAPYCQEVNIRGELLYWRAELGGLQSAFGTTTIDTTVAGGITTTTVTEKDVEPDWKWRPGFRIGADYAFSCFDLEADWTHYVGRATFHEDGQHGNWKIRYDTIDLLFGRRFSIAPCFYFKPFVGVRGARIRQTLKSNLETHFTSIIGDNTVSTVKNDKEKFWGIGPELGLEADWYIACNFSLYGSVDVVSYYGQVRAKVRNTDTFTSTVSDGNGTIRRSFNTIATDAFFGIRWDKAWPVASEVLLTIKLGLEQHRIYDFSDLGSDGTLSMDGANLAASIGYRW